MFVGGVIAADFDGEHHGADSDAGDGGGGRGVGGLKAREDDAGIAGVAGEFTEGGPGEFPADDAGVEGDLEGRGWEWHARWAG